MLTNPSISTCPLKSIGYQRDWMWRGWQIRYSFYRSSSVQNSPLILLHGFGACIEHWRNNMPVLGEYSTVYALDLLGFGGSVKASTRYSVSLWVEQIHDFWHTFIGEPVVLVGNSIGCLVCVGLADTYPEMVKAIAMLSLPDVTLRQEMIPAAVRPILSTIESLFTCKLLLNPIFNLIAKKPATIRRWAKLAYEKKEAVNDELVEILSTPPQDDGAADAFLALAQSVQKQNFSPPVRQILARLTIPMLLIWGKQDVIVPFSIASVFIQVNPAIRFIELDHTGHCPHDENPQVFNELLLGWLREIASAETR